MIPTLSDYWSAKNSDIFAEMDAFETEWRQKHKIKGYDCRSTLRHWSRTWEYPFVFEHVSSGKILDVGCGWSFFPSFIDENIGGEIHLLDSDIGVISWYDHLSRSGFRTHWQDIHHTSFRDEEFDTILCVSTLEHVHNPQAAFLEMQRILKPGGKLILTYDIDLTTMTDPLLGRIDPVPHGTLTSHNAPEGLPGRTDILKKFISIVRRHHPLGHIPHLAVRGVIGFGGTAWVVG